MLKCVIVDGDSKSELNLEYYIKQIEGVCVIGRASDGIEALNVLSSVPCDILFLDLETPLLSGIEVLQSLTLRPITIVISRYTHLAFEAFQLNVIDYIQKPLSFERLRHAVSRGMMYNSSLHKRKHMECISIVTTKGILSLKVASIIHIQSWGNYLKMFCLELSYPILCISTLKEMNDKLNGLGFVQVHKSFLVNETYVVKTNKSEVLLRTGDKIPIGIKYAVMVEKYLV